ncbi:hypothetical protein [Mucilaginibacter ginkgonis]|uniref:Uncharacterized protein n=1 Tax=Mucilaginibacter ginkgonis TaxID=2682091 RepID=A0A6I4HUF0_9SPHI|nr:hypothetical protein GO620_001665 [Mucilaginibacter ginkgonis]
MVNLFQIKKVSGNIQKQILLLHNFGEHVPVSRTRISQFKEQCKELSNRNVNLIAARHKSLRLVTTD